jgi:hypothetical protein
MSYYYYYEHSINSLFFHISWSFFSLCSLNHHVGEGSGANFDDRKNASLLNYFYSILIIFSLSEGALFHRFFTAPDSFKMSLYFLTLLHITNTAEHTEKHEKVLGVGPAENDTQTRSYSLNYQALQLLEYYSQLTTRYTL